VFYAYSKLINNMTAKVKSLRLMLFALVLLMVSVGKVEAQELSYAHSGGGTRHLPNKYWLNAQMQQYTFTERDTIRKSAPEKGTYPDCSAPTRVRWIRSGTDKIQVDWDGTEARPQILYYKVRYKTKEHSTWDEFLATTGHQAILPIALREDAKLWIEVQKLCFDDQSNEWVQSSWIATESDGRAVLVPCKLTLNPTTDIIVQDLWAKGARIKVNNLSSSIDVTKMSYYWVYQSNNVALSINPVTNKPNSTKFTFENGSNTGIVDFNFTTTEAVVLVITGENIGTTDVCEGKSRAIYFVCEKYGTEPGAPLIGGAALRFKNVFSAVLSSNSLGVVVDGDNANNAKGMYYVVKYQPYSLTTNSVYGIVQTKSIDTGKELTLSNLTLVTSYKFTVELWYNGALCKTLTTVATLPDCSNIATLGTITGNSIAISLGNAFQASATNYVEIKLTTAGGVSGTPLKVTNGNYQILSPLQPGTLYNIDIQYFINGFACPIQRLTATTKVDCSSFAGMTASISILSSTSVKVTCSMPCIIPYQFEVRYRKLGDVKYTLATPITAGQNSININGLMMNQVYELEITPKVGDGTVCAAIQKIFSIDCEEFIRNYKDFTLQVGANQVIATISGIAAGNGFSYLVYYREIGTTTWQTQTISVGTSTTPIPIIYGPGYEFKVSIKMGDTVCKDYDQIKTFSLFECKDFKSVKDSALIYNGGYLVMKGPSVDSIKANTYYAIRYAEKGTGQWVSVNCPQGNVYQMKGLKPDTDYEVEVTLTIKNSVVKCTPMLLSFKTPPFVVPTTLKCGGNAPVPKTIDETPVLSILSPGDIITMSGFPIEIESAVGDKNNVFTGTGYLTVPFVDSVVHVELNNVQLNTLMQGFSGTVSSVKNPSGKTINFGGGVINFGGPICVKVPAATDANGFDEDGNYVSQPPYIGYMDGMPLDSTKQYDPCGFDKAGKHKDTGEKTNSSGCTREDIKANIANCIDCYKAPNAYSWLGESGPGAALYALKKDSIKVWTLKKVIQYKAEITDSIQAKRIRCAGLRTEIRTLIAALKYDSTFVFGEESRYINEDMSVYFIGKPLPMQFEGSGRNVKTKELEGKHIALFNSDMQLRNFKMKDTLLEKLSVEPDFGKLLSVIAGNIKKMNKADSAKYSVDKVMKDKIYEYTKIYVEGIVSKGKITAIENRPLLNKSKNESIWSYDTEDIIGVNGFATSSSLSILNPLSRFKKFFGKKRTEDFIQNETPVLENIVVNKAAVYLPVIKKKVIGGKNYSIFFDNLVLSPTSGIVDVAIEIPVPNKNTPISFSATGVGFGVNGFTTANGKNPQLALNTDIEIAITRSMLLTLKGKSPNNPGTYVEFDCDGFAGMGIEAEFEVCRNYLIPVNPTTLEDEPEPKRVKAHIKNLYVHSWNDFIIDNLSIDPFKITGAEQMVWKVSGITLDLSETKKGTVKYSTSYALLNPSIATPAWKGFYMANLSVVMPEGLGKDEKLSGGTNSGQANATSKSLEIGVKDCIFDKLGFTGELFVQNILKLEDGTLGGWAFSMDTIGINIEANSLKGGRFSGLVNVPLFKNSDDKEIKVEDCIKYTAKILPGDQYEFIVTPPLSKMKASVWKAEVSLTSGTAINIKYESGKFTAQALLCGDIGIDGNISSDTKITIPKVHFEGMVLTNKKPYVLNPGTWKFPNQLSAKFSGFELEFKNISPANDIAANLIGVGFVSKIKLAPGDGIDISATGDIAILGKVIEGKHQQWVYEKIKVRQVHVDATFKENHIKGGLIFYDNDPAALKWGKGFRGYLDAKFGALGVDVKAIAQFGKTTHESLNGNEYRYFMVDAMINLGKGISIAPGFNLKGFGGGVTYHLDREASVAVLDSTITSIDTTNITFVALGQSLSKVNYTPKEAIGIGLKATVAIAATAEKAFSANVGLEVLFNSAAVGGGIAKITLDGNARFMSDFKLKALPTKLPTSTVATNANSSPPIPKYNAAPISAKFEMTYNFNKKTFDAVLDVAVDGAKGSLLGGGQAAMHVASKNDWYINIGTPDQRIKLIAAVKVPGASSNSGLQLSAYLDLGTSIPKMPDLPDNIKNATGLGNISANESKRASGKGFAFGASAKLNMSFEQWKVYAGLHLDLGFDVMVQDYGKQTICTNTGEPIGINGWYASGQMYAYIGGDVGIIYKNTSFIGSGCCFASQTS
jgi:hypothetical protein